MPVMEIIAPRGSIRLEDFPAFEDFEPPYRMAYDWRKMTVEQKEDCYYKQKKRCLQHQCQGIKAFMRQHRNGRRNGKNKTG